jgi:hypothetical protein
MFLLTDTIIRFRAKTVTDAMSSTLNSQVEEYLHGLSEQGLPPLYRLSL